MPVQVGRGRRVGFRSVRVSRAPSGVVSGGPGDDDDFRVTLFGDVRQIVVSWSALRHGCTSDDIAHAIRQCVHLSPVPEEHRVWLVLGPDRAGRMLEVVMRVHDDTVFVFHSMPMRRRFGRLLGDGGGDDV